MHLNLYIFLLEKLNKYAEADKHLFAHYVHLLFAIILAFSSLSNNY